MDSIPRYEFHKIFQRLSYTVNLKGAFTTEEIDRRLERAISNFREAAHATWREPEKKRLFEKAKAIETLKNKGFAEATIKEAYENRYGFVALTLHYSVERAEDLKRAFERARLRGDKRK